MTFEEALAYMSGLLRFGWKPGLSRIEELCSLVGNPQNAYKVVHVTGTKGKGSTTAMAASILHAHGLKTGSYFSPYVYDVCERVQVDGEPIARHVLAALVNELRVQIELLSQTDLGQTTEFELKTALGFLYFARQQVDWASIEVGLGGRLDATNVVKPSCTVITNIGLDHTEILGDTHAAIAYEKAGIIKETVPVVTAARNQEALDVITEIARVRHAPLIRIIESQTPPVNSREELVCWSPASNSDRHVGRMVIATPTSVYEDVEIGLQGAYQRENAACAVAAVEQALARHGLSVRPDALRSGLANCYLPGRMETYTLPHESQLVLDGAHNLMAAQALMPAVNALIKRNDLQRIYLVVGMLTGHDPDEIMRTIAAFADRTYCCAPQWKRARAAEEIGTLARNYCSDVRVFDTVMDAALSAIGDAPGRTLVLVTGSFYTVGECAALRGR